MPITREEELADLGRRQAQHQKETAEWKAALAWCPLVSFDLSEMSLEMALVQSEVMGIKPVRLVIGPFDRTTINRWGDRNETVEVTDDHVLVSQAESFRIIREGSSSVVLEVVIGDFPDDGRWYIETHDGKRLGSV